MAYVISRSFWSNEGKKKQQKIKKVSAFSIEVPLTFLIFIFDMTLTHFHLTLS